MDNTIWIVLGSVFSVLLLGLLATLLLFCRKRSKKKVRIFSLRAVTPLDDAEFESWRRPTTSRPEKYGAMPSRPAVVRAKNITNLFEKEVALYNMAHTPPQTPPQTPPKSDTPTSPVKLPDHARRKSSVSIQDRPPTPFSQDMSEDDPALWLPKIESPRSRGHVHYPSVSEASEFDFGFSTPPRHSDRFSGQSERRLYTRARQHSMT